MILYLCPLESDIPHSPRRTAETSVLRMSRRALAGARGGFQPAAINECCRPSLHMVQRALPNLRILSGALLSAPLCLETRDSKKISALIILFLWPSEFYVCRENPENMKSKGHLKQNKKFCINIFCISILYYIFCIYILYNIYYIYYIINMIYKIYYIIYNVM